MYLRHIIAIPSVPLNFALEKPGRIPIKAEQGLQFDPLS